MLEYIITEYSEALKQFCMIAVVGTNKAQAETAKTEYEAKNPNKKYAIEAIEPKNQWWHQGWLD